MDSIGFIADPDHPLFWPVAERLAARGFGVEFLRPSDPIQPADILDLSAIANGVVHPNALTALRYADTQDVPTWNGYTMTVALSARLVELEALASVGCAVPDVQFDGPKAEFAAGHRYVWQGVTTPSESAPLYVEQVRTGPIDYRYCAVNDGRETHIRALQLRNSLSGTEELIAEAEVNVTVAARVRELLDRFGGRAVAVDFTEADDGECYALRATPVPNFTGTRLDRRVADSVASLTTIGE